MGMRRAQWIIYGFGTLLLGLFSVGSGFGIIQRIEAGEPYALNLYFHPITAILFVYLLFKTLERLRKEQQAKFQNNHSSQNQNLQKPTSSASLGRKTSKD